MTEEKVNTILRTARDSRYLEAERLLNEVEKELAPMDVMGFLKEQNEEKAREALGNIQEETHKPTLYALLANRAKLKEILHRAGEIKHAVNWETVYEGVSGRPSQWKLGASYFGIETYFKIDNGKITVRMEGGLTDLPLFEQCAVIHEVDLFREWVPFCDESVLLEKLGPAELLMYLSIDVLFLSRDTCMHTWGADCLHENGQILLFGYSVNHKVGDGHYHGPTDVEKDWHNGRVTTVCTYSEQNACPWRKETWTHAKMDIIDFKAMFKPISATEARTVIEASVDPKVPLHDALVNFIIKKMAGQGGKTKLIAHMQQRSTFFCHIR